MKARLGQVPQPDFILWPENSTDIDPLLDPVTRATVQSAAEVAGRPILVGAVLEGPGEDERQTTALWWDPQRGVVGSYAKRNLVPFGEWIPFRGRAAAAGPDPGEGRRAVRTGHETWRADRARRRTKTSRSVTSSASSWLTTTPCTRR